MKHLITLIPVGGLANRMKAIEAGIRLAHSVGSKLEILWFRTWEVNCPFKNIFEELRIADVEFKEAGWKEMVLKDRPRKKNLWIPTLYEQLTYDSSIYEGEATKLRDNGFDFKSWANHRCVYLASCVDFLPCLEGQDFSIFKPIPCIKQNVEKTLYELGHEAIGIHIRRTDNVRSIQLSPTVLFETRIRKQLAQKADSRFYLATDDEQEKIHFKSLFEDHIITSSLPADRNSISGIQAAVTEMFILSRMSLIWGSAQSSFSETAAHINHVPFELLTIK